MRWRTARIDKPRGCTNRQLSGFFADDSSVTYGLFQARLSWDLGSVMGDSLAYSEWGPR
jgi:hypothetical protein